MIHGFAVGQTSVGTGPVSLSINISAGSTSSNVNAVTFSNANGVTFGYDGTNVTASVAPSGGQLNISAGTTSSAVTAVTFENSNGVSFGFDGSNVTATVATNYQSQGAYLTTAMASNRGSDFVQATANFFGTNASGTINSNAISVSVAAPANNSINISAGTTSSNVTAVTFANSNGVTFGFDGTNVTATVQTNYLTTAMASNRGSDFVQATAVFHGTNASGTIASGDVSVSVAAQSVQTQNNVDISLSGNTAGVLALISSGTAILAGGNNITLSQNGQSVTISGPNTVAQTVQTQNCVDLSLSGNTSGVLALISSGTAILAGGNNITLSQNGQSVTISAASQSVQTQNLVDVSLSGNTTGTLTLVSSGTVILAGGNNITLSQNGQSITISAFNQSVQTQNCVDLTLGGNTTGTLTLISSGTAFLAGGNNITLSQNGQSVTISCGAAGTGFTTASTAGSDIVGTLNTAGLSMGVPKYLTTAEQSRPALSYWSNVPYYAVSNVTSRVQSNTFQVLPIMLLEKVSIGYLRLMGNMQLSSTTIATSAVNNATGASTAFSETIAWNAVLYTVGVGASSRSLQYVYSTSVGMTFAASVSQASTSNASQQSISVAITFPREGSTTIVTSTQYSVSATNGPISTTDFGAIQGNRFLDIPFSTSLGAGNYWMAVNRITGTVGGKNIDIDISSYGATGVGLTMGAMNVGVNVSNECPLYGLGVWTTNVAQTSSSIAFASISATGSYFLPYVQFINQS